MGIEILSTNLNILNMKTRMPFKYGIATLTELPHLFVRVKLKVNDKIALGISSDGLPPKWFTKYPNTSPKEDLQELLAVIDHAKILVEEKKIAESVYDFWKAIYYKQLQWGEENGYPPLLSGFGVSLFERAIMDAFCRCKSLTFAQAIYTNAFEINLGDLYNELQDKSPRDFLTDSKGEEIKIRHTVGMADYINIKDVPSSKRMDDGLPQTLEEVIEKYRVSMFKIKLSGNLGKDKERLSKISKLLQEKLGNDYSYTLDGNEQFEDPMEFKKFWEKLVSISELKGFLSNLIFVEQPIKRDKAFISSVKDTFLAWEERPPMIIDESDSKIGSLVEALNCGYHGTSHKNCKGVIKGIANACLLKYRKSIYPDKQYILSGEDLANVGPIALFQDLSVMKVLGVEHVERNGHHYFKGLSMYPSDIQKQIEKIHSDLYESEELGFPTLRIVDGKINISSLMNSPFGYDIEIDTTRFSDRNQWKYEDMIGQKSSR